MYCIELAKNIQFRQILNIYKPFITSSHVSFETTPPTPKEFSERIKKTMINFPWLVCFDKNTLTGFACASGHRQRDAYKWSVEVSVYIDKSYQKRKIATGLYTSLFEILMLQNYRNVLAGITLPNEASVAFHESMGFRKIAEYQNIGYKAGKWHNVGWWQKYIGNFEAVPDPPITLNKVVHTPHFEKALTKGEKCIL